MARNLTEDEVKWIEERRKQKEEQSRRDEFEGGMSGEELDALDKRRQEMAEGWRKARVNAMGDAARGWRRDQAGREQAEREHWDAVYRQNHGGLSKAEVQSFGRDGSGSQAKGMARAMELQAAREHEAGMQGKEMDTRIKEAELKRLGMKEQGSDAAKSHSDATIRAAELQAASAEKIAGINKDRDLGVAEWGYKGKKDEGDAKVEAAGLQADATVKATEVQAQAQEARLYAENLMKTRNLDQRQAMQFARMREQKINKIMEQRRSKQTGKYTITREEAAKMADEELERQGLPGTAKKTLSDFEA